MSLGLPRAPCILRCYLMERGDSSFHRAPKYRGLPISQYELKRYRNKFESFQTLLLLEQEWQ